MTMKRFISDDDARSLNLFAAFTEVDMTALFDRERSQARFAARNDANVYNPVRLYEMEVSEDMSAENEKADIQIKGYFTPSQVEAMDAARAKAGHNKSEAIREAMRLYCERYGIDFDPTVDQRGGWQGNDASKEALRKD